MCKGDAKNAEPRKEMELQAITGLLVSATDRLAEISRRTRNSCNKLVGAIPEEVKADESLSAAKPEIPDVLATLTNCNRRIRNYTVIISYSVSRL